MKKVSQGQYSKELQVESIKDDFYKKHGLQANSLHTQWQWMIKHYFLRHPRHRPECPKK